MAERKSVKRKVITAVVIVGVFVLLIGSFFFEGYLSESRYHRVRKA